MFKSKHCGIEYTSILSEKSAGNNQNPASQHWADSAQKTETSREDMTKYLAQWFHKKMTWADLCAVASAAADLLDWLADRMWIEQKTRSDLWKIFGGKIEIFQKQSVTRRQPETTRTLSFFLKDSIWSVVRKSEWGERSGASRDLRLKLQRLKGASIQFMLLFTRPWCCKLSICKFRHQ